jgi:hypothetical protein
MTKKVQPVLKRRQLQFGKYLDISTGHMADRDMELLKKDDGPLAVYPYTEGYWVHVSPDIKNEAALCKLGFSEGFAKVYLAAKRAGCWFIRFDCDGFMYERFLAYEW